jgi:hypothetical protein
VCWNDGECSVGKRHGDRVRRRTVRQDVVLSCRNNEVKLTIQNGRCGDADARTRARREALWFQDARSDRTSDDDVRSRVVASFAIFRISCFIL